MRGKYIISAILLLILAGVSIMRAEDDPIGKGSYLIGGMFGVAFVGGDLYGNPDDAYQVRIELDWQRFFVPKLAIGLRGLFDYEQAFEDKKTIRGIGPAVSYYLGLMDYNTYAFVESSLMYTFITFDTGSGDEEITSLSYDASIGFAQFLVKNIALVGKLEYRHTTLDYDQDEDLEENEVGVAFGLRAFIY
jgi:hypothetical protein